MADKKNGSQSSKTPGDMTKKAAVEKGLSDLGNAATPTELQKHIQDNYGIDMEIGHISSAKAKILSAARQSKPAAAKQAATKPSSQQAIGRKPVVRLEESAKGGLPQGGEAQGIGLGDIETVKDLVERVGAVSLKKLIDVMAR
jgi:hypothetical protein